MHDTTEVIYTCIITYQDKVHDQM